MFKHMLLKTTENTPDFLSTYSVLALFKEWLNSEILWCHMFQNDKLSLSIAVTSRPSAFPKMSGMLHLCITQRIPVNTIMISKTFKCDSHSHSLSVAAPLEHNTKYCKCKFSFILTETACYITVHVFYLPEQSTTCVSFCTRCQISYLEDESI